MLVTPRNFKGCITAEQKEELYQLAYEMQPKVGLVSLLEKLYGGVYGKDIHVSTIKSYQFDRVYKSIQAERERVIPLQDKAKSLAKQPIFGQLSATEQSVLEAEIALQLGAYAFQSELSQYEDPFGEKTKRIKKYADVAVQLDQGAQRFYILQNTKKEQMIFDDLVSLQQEVSKRIKETLEAYRKVLDSDDQEDAEIWQSLQDQAEEIQWECSKEIPLFVERSFHPPETEDKEIDRQNFFQVKSDYTPIS